MLWLKLPYISLDSTIILRSVAKHYIDSNEKLQTALEIVYKRLHVFQELDPIFGVSTLSIFFPFWMAPTF